MRYFLPVILVLLLAGWAQGATYYVKWDATGEANGSDWTNAFTTIAAAISAAGAGDSIYISGGDTGHVYNEITGGIFGDRHLYGATESGHNGAVVIDGTGVQTSHTVDVSGIGCSITNLTLKSDVSETSYALRVTGANFTGTDLRFEDSYYPLLITGASSILIRPKFLNCFDASAATRPAMKLGNSSQVNYPWFENSGRVWLYGTGEITIANPVVINGRLDAFNILEDNPTVNIYNPLVVGTPNEISGGNQREVFANNRAAEGGVLTVYNPLVLLNTNSMTTATYDGFDDNTVVVGTNIDTNPRFQHLRRPVLVSVAVDDWQYKSHFDNLATEAQARGVPATFNVNTRTDGVELTSEQYGELQEYINNGHGISSHGRALYGRISTFEGVDIQYTGAAASATMTFSGSTFTTSTTGEVDDLTIDVTGYATVNALATAINNDDNYTCAMNTENSHLDLNPTLLADVTAQDIKTAAYHWQADETRMWDYEIAGSKTDLETNLDGYTVNSWVYPQNGISDDAMQAVFEGGYEGAAVPGSTWNLEDILAYKIRRFSVGTDGVAVISEDHIDRDVTALVHMMGYFGGACQIYTHDNLTQAQFGELLDALIDNGATIMTLGDIVDYIIDNADTTSGSEGQLRYQLTSLGDESNYTLRIDSPAINAGTKAGTVSLTGNQKDYFGNEYFFTPYDTLNIGPNQEYSRAAERPTSGGVIIYGEW